MRSSSPEAEDEAVLLVAVAAGIGGEFEVAYVDRSVSSAPWFAGWATDVPRWKRNIVDEPRPTALASTWLLSTGWLKLGALRFNEAPA